jgi:hypothetical protein
MNVVDVRARPVLVRRCHVGFVATDYAVASDSPVLERLA